MSNQINGKELSDPRPGISTANSGIDFAGVIDKQIKDDFFENHSINSFQGTLEAIKPSHYEDIFKVLLAAHPIPLDQSYEAIGIHFQRISVMAKIATGVMLEGSL